MKMNCICSADNTPTEIEPKNLNIINDAMTIPATTKLYTVVLLRVPQCNHR